MKGVTYALDIKNNRRAVCGGADDHRGRFNLFVLLRRSRPSSHFRDWRLNQYYHARHRGKARRYCVPHTVLPHFTPRHPGHSGMVDRQTGRPELLAPQLHHKLKIRRLIMRVTSGQVGPKLLFTGRRGAGGDDLFQNTSYQQGRNDSAVYERPL